MLPSIHASHASRSARRSDWTAIARISGSTNDSDCR
jgi:hypothetical protein